MEHIKQSLARIVDRLAAVQPDHDERQLELELEVAIKIVYRDRDADVFEEACLPVNPLGMIECE